MRRRSGAAWERTNCGTERRPGEQPGGEERSLRTMGHWVKPPVCGREKRGTPGSRRVRPEAKQAGAGRCRQIRKATALKLTAAAFFLLLVLLLVGLTLGPEPVPGEEKAKYAAAYAAGQVYEAVMDRCGDEALARMEADRIYEETMQQWNENGAISG